MCQRQLASLNTQNPFAARCGHCVPRQTAQLPAERSCAAREPHSAGTYRLEADPRLRTSTQDAGSSSQHSCRGPRDSPVLKQYCSKMITVQPGDAVVKVNIVAKVLVLANIRGLAAGSRA